MSKQKKIAIIIAGALVALLIFSVTLLPIVVKNKAREAIQQATGRTVRIESVSINPFVLAVGVKGVAIEEKGGGPFIACTGLRATISPASIYKRALILSEITLESPSFSITRTAPNRYSFTDIIERQQALKKPVSQSPMLYSINNITVTNGTVDFDDRAVDGGRKHTVRNLQFAIPFISNMPYLMEKYTDPKLSAVVDGAPFSFAGKVKPFSKSMETEVNIHLNQLNLPRLVAYSPQPPPGRIDCWNSGRRYGCYVPSLCRQNTGVNDQGARTVGRYRRKTEKRPAAVQATRLESQGFETGNFCQAVQIRGYHAGWP
jgi:hypothetical protein